MLAVDRAVDAEIAPGDVELLAIQLTELKNKGRIGKMGELTTVRIEFGDEFPRITFKAEFAKVELEVVAVGAHHGGGESGRFITARPMKRRFKDNFFHGVAL